MLRELLLGSRLWGRTLSLCDVLTLQIVCFANSFRSLSSGGEYLVELNHCGFRLLGEIEFLDEFSLQTGTMYWTLHRTLFTSLKNCPAHLSFVLLNVCGLWKESRIIFFHHLQA